MSKKMKKLIERVEAIEAEIKAFKETAEKNVATISAEIEKLVAATKTEAEAPVKRTRKVAAPVKKATTPAKPTRKPRAKTAEAKKEPVVQEKTAVPEQEKPAPTKAVETAEAPAEQKQAEPKATRTRKPKAVASRTARASFALYNCDEAKTPESKYNRNDETFSDTQKGRRGLWNKLKTEIEEKRMELLDNYPIRNVRLEIQDGKPESVSKHLQYGLIEKVESNQ